MKIVSWVEVKFPGENETRIIFDNLSSQAHQMNSIEFV